MTPEEIRDHANRRIAQAGPDSEMVLTVVRSKEPGETVKMPMGGPKGRVVRTSENGDGRVRVTAFFRCSQVLAWITPHCPETATAERSDDGAS